jgi:hypothetical protein
MGTKDLDITELHFSVCRKKIVLTINTVTISCSEFFLKI